MKTRQVMCYAQIFNFASKVGLKRTKFGCKIKYLSVAHHLPRFHFSESRYVKESIEYKPIPEYKPTSKRKILDAKKPTEILT